MNRTLSTESRFFGLQVLDFLRISNFGFRSFCLLLVALDWTVLQCPAATLEPVEVEGQPLAANVERLRQSLEFLGAPLPPGLVSKLTEAGRQRDASALQRLLDDQVLLVVNINPEARVKVTRGPAQPRIQQAGYTPILVKVINDSTATSQLRIHSPQSGAVYAGVAPLSMNRQNQEHLRLDENKERRTDRFLDLEMFSVTPMTANLSGLRVEYAIALVYSSEAGRREAVINFSLGEGTQDLGFRGETPVLFDIQSAIPVRLAVTDVDGRPGTGRFLFSDAVGRVYPPQAKRLAPDFFFQKQIYRADGELVLLAPGKFKMWFGRGPEYRWIERDIEVPRAREHSLAVRLERWVNPMDHGYYGGDHHIHAAGCAHYTSPTEGVQPADMFRQVKGEGLNVGCILTWGPCFDYQHQFFSPSVDKLSEPLTLLKYDVEVSGFGSQALGHVCLLNLKNQIYPGAHGSKDWPTWTTPVLRWAKSQGGVVGYAHSGSGLQVNPAAAAKRLLAELDVNRNGLVERGETEDRLLPEPFEKLDDNSSGSLSEDKLRRSIDRVADQLPNLAIPELNSVGAQEIFVTTAQGLCDFISAMDTARLLEWNCWYHLLNCGFPLRVSGETDFPCMSGTRVGQGRVYVQLGKVDRLDYGAWCEGIARGRSYVSDGYAHALEFSVEGRRSGEILSLDSPRSVKVRARVAFSSETPLEPPYGGVMPAGGPRLVGDTVNLHPAAGPGVSEPGKRSVELIVNGRPVASQVVLADDRMHDLEFTVNVDRSSWVALRHFPQLHTNPVEVRIAGKSIRASRSSALWCVSCIEQLWRVRERVIAPAERDEARKTFGQAMETYRRIASESPPGS
jgi:hypothetical protein